LETKYFNEAASCAISDVTVTKFCSKLLMMFEHYSEWARADTAECKSTTWIGEIRSDWTVRQKEPRSGPSDWL